MSSIYICYERSPDSTHSLRHLERGECHFNDLFNTEVATFESNIAYTLRFMIDTKVCSIVWVQRKELNLYTGCWDELD